MVLHQVSYEAPAIFLILQSYFQNKNFDELKTLAGSKGVSATEHKQFLAYAAGFYNNMGNYKSFGSRKFVPEINEETFEKILQSNPL